MVFPATRFNGRVGKRKRNKTMLLRPMYVFCMVIDSYGEHGTRDKNSGYIVLCGIHLTKIKRVLSASRCGRDGRRYQYMCSSNRFELRHFKRIRISCGSMISPQSHTKRISRTETPSHPELIPSVLPRGESVFREIM